MSLFRNIGLCCCLLACQGQGTYSERPDGTDEFKVRVVVAGREHVWDLVQVPGKKIWFTERSGLISELDPVTGKVREITRIPDVQSRGEGGLLGMAVSRQFEQDHQVFVVYNYQGKGGYKEKVVSYTYDGAGLTGPTILLDNIDASGIHNGSRLLAADNKLFITTGDASRASQAQDLSSLNGKVLRIGQDGSIPEDNPFQGSPVWSYGHRNPQGLILANGVFYSSEHGPSNDDEINIIEKGRNYGWPLVEGKCDRQDERAFCKENQVVEPIYTWTPTLAVSGIDFYDKDLISEFKNSILLCTLKDETLLQLKLDTGGKRIADVRKIFSGTYGRLRDVLVSEDGKVYVCTSNGSDDKILQISTR